MHTETKQNQRIYILRLFFLDRTQKDHVGVEARKS